MVKRIIVIVAFPFAVLLWAFVCVPVEYIRTGKVDVNNNLMDALARWAE